MTKREIKALDKLAKATLLMLAIKYGEGSFRLSEITSMMFILHKHGYKKHDYLTRYLFENLYIAFESDSWELKITDIGREYINGD